MIEALLGILIAEVTILVFLFTGSWRLAVGFLVAALAVIALAGCATTTSVVPPQLLSCAPQPPAPSAGTQRDVSLYVVDLAAAGDDCRTKLGSVRTILED